MTLHHLGVAVPDLARALPSYERLFGYRLLSGPFEDPIQGVSVCFVGTGKPGEPTIELIAPLRDAAASPVASTLKQGGGAYHLCYEVDDIAAELRRAQSLQCLIVSQPVPAVAFGGRRIAWYLTPTRQLIELVEAPPQLHP